MNPNPESLNPELSNTNRNFYTRSKGTVVWTGGGRAGM
jgi:hypothetical protein